MASRQAAIRAKCMVCCADSETAIRCCTVLDCPLWDYRMGYPCRRNEQYYDHDLYWEHLEKSQEEFNRVLKGAQKQSVEAA